MPEEINRLDYDRCMKIVKDSGIVVTQFSPSDVEKLEEISRTKVWEANAAKLDKKGLPGTRVLKHYIQLQEKHLCCSPK